MKFSLLAFLSGVLERLNAFLETREEKQKNAIVGAFFIAVLLADFFLLVQPVIQVFTGTIPELAVQKQRLSDLQEDIKNVDGIEKQWEDTRQKLAATEKQFIPKEEIPSLLESLSKLAQESKVRIVTLKPLEPADAGSDLLRIPIYMSAVAGTHDLGRFLSLLEGGDTFFKVTDLRIAANALDDYRHTIELSIEAYAKVK